MEASNPNRTDAKKLADINALIDPLRSAPRPHDRQAGRLVSERVCSVSARACASLRVLEGGACTDAQFIAKYEKVLELNESLEKKSMGHLFAGVTKIDGGDIRGKEVLQRVSLAGNVRNWSSGLRGGQLFRKWWVSFLSSSGKTGECGRAAGDEWREQRGREKRDG